MAGVATQITLSGVRKALATARLTGAYRGVHASPAQVKDTIRTVYHVYGPDQADRLVTGWNTAFDPAQTVRNVKKTGIPVRKLPKNSVAVSPAISRDTTSKIFGAARSDSFRQRLAKKKRSM